MLERPTWDEYFMELATIAAKRSTCMRRQIGAVLVRDRRVLSTGYNGVPRGLAHCEDVGCLRESMGIPSGERVELCRAVHAEQNAVVQAALGGVSPEGAEIYTTTYPCVLCTKVLINAGIVRVVYRDPFPDKLSAELLAEAGIPTVQFNP